jgi:nicotinate-nucleotide--dimethylbenzimidazole phosphoribosyltransferase
MGIGNTATASVLMSIILALPIADCVGKERVSQTLIEKINILKKCLDNYEGENNLESKLAYWRI